MDPASLVRQQGSETGRGLLVHAFCGASRNVFEDVAREQGLAHVAIDQKEDLMRTSLKIQRDGQRT